MAWTTATERVLEFPGEIWARDIGVERVVQIDSHEFYVVVTCKSRDENGTLTALDVSGAGTMTLVLIDPKGARSRHTLTARSGGTDGLIQYQIADGDLEKPGQWQLYAEIAFSTGLITTQRSLLFVESDLTVAPEKKNAVDYSVTSHDATAAAGTYILYLKNDNPAPFAVDHVEVGAVETGLWKLWVVTGTAAAGSALAVAPLNLIGTDSSSWTARGDDAITGLTAANQLGAIRCPANDSRFLNFGGSLILDNGSAIAVEYDTGTTGIAEATIRGMLISEATIRNMLI